MPEFFALRQTAVAPMHSSAHFQARDQHSLLSSGVGVRKSQQYVKKNCELC